MKTIIPKNLKGKDLYKWLVDNEDKLIAEKKSMVKHTDPISVSPVFMSINRPEEETKDGNSPTPVIEVPGQGQLDVKVVANTAWYADQSLDVLSDKCYDRSIQERGNLIPHISDHEWKSTSHVGDVRSVYKQQVKLSELGYEGTGKATALVFETRIREDYNDKTYKFYKNGKIKQHSIGLFLITFGLCINDQDYLPQFELWKKYYDKIINKDVVDKAGYFWIVLEIKILENSCVLFGCNELTPTLETEEVESTGKGSQQEIDEPGVPTPIKTLTFKGMSFR